MAIFNAYTTGQLLDATIASQEHQMMHPELYTGLRTFPWLVERTGQLRKGWIFNIMAAGGVGKSTFLSQLMIYAITQGMTFCYFTMEDTLEMLGQRFLSNLSEIARTKFRDVHLTTDELAKAKLVAGEHKDSVGWFLGDMYTEAEITPVVQQYQPDIIAIDYLQLMEFAQARTTSEAVSKASKYCVRLARKTIPHPTKLGAYKKSLVACAVQLNDDEEPLWSRDPNRDGDVNVILRKVSDHSGGYLPDRLEMEVRKNRHGTGGEKIELAFHAEFSRIGELWNPMAPMAPPRF
jgi:replicative DNA helicase